MNWYVIYTWPRWDLKIYKALLESGIFAYCNTYSELRQWSDSKKKITKAYINPYVFEGLEEAYPTCVFNIPRVVGFVYWLGKAVRLQEFEVHLMKEYLDE